MKIDDAHNWLCPTGRTFSVQHINCIGPQCPVWRFQPLSAELLLPHIAARKAEQGDKDHKAATAWVMENREALGIPMKPTHGYCGLGGAE